MVPLKQPAWMTRFRAQISIAPRAAIAVLCLSVICIGLGVVSVLAGKGIQSTASTLIAHGGIPAYFVAMTVIHILILPVLPDPLVALAPILFPKSYWLVLVLSATAPVVAALIDLYLGWHYGRSLLEKIGGPKAVKTGEYLARRYGAYAVLLSGILPLNFSLLCWACGMLRVSPARVMLAVLVTRVPRYVLVYMFGSELIKKLIHWLWA